MYLLQKFVALQSELLEGFFVAFPLVRDYRWLSDFPRSGDLTIGGATWTFCKHGAGLRFTRRGAQAMVVDVHRAILRPDQFDSWRLSTYLESIGEPLDENHVQGVLDKMVKDKVLHTEGDGFFSLA